MIINRQTSQKFQRKNINPITKKIILIFKNKPDKQDPIMIELNESFLLIHRNLTPEFMMKYRHFNNKIPMFITRNGNTGIEILKRMGIKIPVLNMTCYDTKNNGNFYL